METSASFEARYAPLLYPTILLAHNSDASLPRDKCFRGGADARFSVGSEAPPKWELESERPIGWP